MDRDNEIARVEHPGDWDNCGWVACCDGTLAEIFRFSHCSCFGTYDGDAPSRQWSGTREEMIAMAKDGRDPEMPERNIVPGEYDADDILQLFREILLWASSLEATSEVNP